MFIHQTFIQGLLWATYSSSSFTNINFFSNQPMTNLFSNYYRYTTCFSKYLGQVCFRIQTLYFEFHSGQVLSSNPQCQVKFGCQIAVNKIKTKQQKPTSSFQSIEDFRKGVKEYYSHFADEEIEAQKLTNLTRFIFSGERVSNPDSRTPKLPTFSCFVLLNLVSATILIIHVKHNISRAQ